MREKCSCGASIRTLSRHTLTDWRTNHRHDPHEEPEPDKMGADSRTEHAGARYFEQESPYGPDVPIIMGFTPNPEGHQ